MKARGYLALGLGLVGALLFLNWYARTAQTRSWETNVSPTDKPVVNFVISSRDNAEPFLQRVLLCAEEPRSGKLLKRAMDFNARSVGHNKIEFELKEHPGDLLELALSPMPGGSFQAELRSKSTATIEVLQFEEVR